MKISKNKAIKEDWDEVKSWNYKLPHLDPKMSVVYAELDGEHGLVHTNEIERVYYIIEGQGEFIFNKERINEICKTNNTGYVDLWMKKQTNLNDYCKQFSDIKLKQYFKRFFSGL